MIYIITLPNQRQYNFGGVLQNYALQKYLRDNGYQVTCLHCNTDSVKQFLRYSLLNLFMIDISVYKKKIKINFAKKRDLLRNKIFTEFIYKNIAPYNVKWFDKDKFSRICSTADRVIVGSDQVWNPFWAVTSKTYDKFFLSFVPYEKRVSYAASFGVSQLPDSQKDLFKKGLNGIKYLSVREEEGAEIVESVIGKRPEVVIDPTLLLERKQWDAVLVKPQSIPKGKFMLVYFLGEVSNMVQMKIQRIAKKYQLEILNINDVNEQYYLNGPGEFIYFISKANLVYTDSFHATVFSLLYNRPFIVEERDNKGIDNMNSRIMTLLNMVGLQERYQFRGVDEGVFSNDYQRAYEILHSERENAHRFLKKALT